MKKILIFILLYAVTLNVIAQYRNVDTLYIEKESDNEYRFRLSEGDTSIKFRTLLMIQPSGEEKWLEMNGGIIKIVENEIKIRMRRATDPYSEEFYIRNFPSVKASIDTAKNYNIIELGEVTGILNRLGEIEYSYEFYDDNYLQDFDHREVREKFNNLSLDHDFAKWDCESLKDAVLFFEKITWLTEVYDSFSVEEYETLKTLLAPCLGPELGEGYLEARELIRFMK